MSRFLQNYPSGFEIVQDYLNEIEKTQNKIILQSKADNFKESGWMILRLNHQKTKYIQKLHAEGRISAVLVSFLRHRRLIDGDLLGLWRRRGMESLCCTHCAGTDGPGGGCVCRVPGRSLNLQHPIECDFCGCKGCSGY